jgi:SAM-dependent methyltransferase
VAAIHRVNNAIRLRELRGLRPGRLLDVGSGRGRFLAAARDAGWSVLGVEFAAGVAAISREVHGLDVIVGDFLSVPISGPFDVVTMWHTLEHLQDPEAALNASAALLAPNGRLIVSVPNSSSAQARLGGDAWFHLDIPRHLFHFTPEALTALLRRTGFDVERIDFFYPEMEAIGLIQTVLNKAGLGDDTLYRFAKSDETVARGGRLVTSGALALVVAPVAGAWSLIAPLLRTGTSMQFLARKAGSGEVRSRSIAYGAKRRETSGVLD